jgi:hypothetical protein
MEPPGWFSACHPQGLGPQHKTYFEYYVPSSFQDSFDVFVQGKQRRTRDIPFCYTRLCLLRSSNVDIWDTTEPLSELMRKRTGIKQSG